MSASPFPAPGSIRVKLLFAAATPPSRPRCRAASPAARLVPLSSTTPASATTTGSPSMTTCRPARASVSPPPPNRLRAHPPLTTEPALHQTLRRGASRSSSATCCYQPGTGSSATPARDFQPARPHVVLRSRQRPRLARPHDRPSARPRPLTFFHRLLSKRQGTPLHRTCFDFHPGAPVRSRPR